MRYLRLPVLLLWLAALWVALWGEVSWGNVVSGLAVAVGVLAVARPTGVTGLERYYLRPIAAARYAGYFLVQLVKSNLIVAWEIVTPGTRVHRAIIRVPLHTTSAGVATLVANSITLTPGTVTIDVDEHIDADGAATYTLFVHVLLLDDVASVRRDVLQLERLAVKAFGRRADLAAVEASWAATQSAGAAR